MQEFVDFLGGQAPYDALDNDDLQRLADRVEVEYHARGATIVEADGPQLDHLSVLRTGRVHVIDRGRIVDELGPGDTFGHISVLSGLPPPLAVVAAEDTLNYRFPDPRTFLHHPERLSFAHYNSLVNRGRVVESTHGYQTRPVTDFMRRPVWCDSDDTVADVARSVTDAGASFALLMIDSEIAIITDSDFRSRVATGQVPTQARAGSIATTPAAAVDAHRSAAAAFLEMVNRGVHHLVVTGSRGEAVGVVRVVDLSSSEIRDPLLIRSQIAEAQGVEDLAAAFSLLGPTLVELAQHDLPRLRVAELQAAITDAAVVRAVDLQPALADHDEAAWLVLGSLARAEPLPQSDLDTALIWRDETTTDGPDRLVAAEHVLDTLERAGMRRCPDGANATNPLFNRTRRAWVDAASRWVDQPTAEGALLLSAMVADSRPVTGLPLGRTATNTIEHRVLTRTFLSRQLQAALQLRPPTGFVRDFVVEESGQHRGQLDLKRRGLAPVVAIGRWVALSMGDTSGSTVERLRRAVGRRLLSQDESDVLIGAFEDGFELLFASEVESMTRRVQGSTYIDPRNLDTLTRRHLRESFRAIAKVQARLEGDWVSRLS